jgi:hypothetical protein
MSDANVSDATQNLAEQDFMAESEPGRTQQAVSKREEKDNIRVS